MTRPDELAVDELCGDPGSVHQRRRWIRGEADTHSLRKAVIGHSDSGFTRVRGGLPASLSARPASTCHGARGSPNRHDPVSGDRDPPRQRRQQTQAPGDFGIGSGSVGQARRRRKGITHAECRTRNSGMKRKWEGDPPAGTRRPQDVEIAHEHLGDVRLALSGPETGRTHPGTLVSTTATTATTSAVDATSASGPNRHPRHRKAARYAGDGPPVMRSRLDRAHQSAPRSASK